MSIPLCFMFMFISFCLMSFHGCGNLHFVYCWCSFALCFMVVGQFTLIFGCGHFILWLWWFHVVHLHFLFWWCSFHLDFFVVVICTLFIVDVHWHFVLRLMFICTLFYGCCHLHFVHCWCSFALYFWLWSFALCLLLMLIGTLFHGCGHLHILLWLWLFALCLLLMFISTLF